MSAGTWTMNTLALGVLVWAVLAVGLVIALLIERARCPDEVRAIQDELAEKEGIKSSLLGLLLMAAILSPLVVASYVADLPKVVRRFFDER